MTKNDSMRYSNELVPRILRDVDDGVLVLDRQGNISYMNPQCETLLGIKEAVLGKRYADVFFKSASDKENDAFHQFVLDAVYQKEETHRGTVAYIDPNGHKKYLRITSSFLRDEDATEKSGIVTVISDVTEAEELRKKKRDATVMFVCVTACIGLYLFLLATLDFLKFNVPTKMLTQVINFMVLAFSVIIYNKTDLSFDDLGLKIRNPKSTFGIAFAISCGVAGLLILAKLVLLQVAPGFFASGAPFWNWNIGLYSWISYLFTSLLQEFLARSMIYGSIRKMFDGKHSTISAIAISSLLFGAVHIAHGFMYMVAAIILLGALGGLYERQRNIWGVAIIHYVLGQAACCLGFLA